MKFLSLKTPKTLKKHKISNNLSSLKSHNVGFTLIELTMTIIILSIISVSLASFMSSSVKAYIVSMDNARGVDELRYAMNRLSYEIRNVDHNGTEYQLVTNIGGGPASTRFEYVNTDGATIVFEYDAGAGLLTIDDSAVGVVGAILANQVTAFDFNYYQSDGVSSASNGANLFFVEFQISLQEAGVTYSSRSRVALRDQI